MRAARTDSSRYCSIKNTIAWHMINRKRFASTYNRKSCVCVFGRSENNCIENPDVHANCSAVAAASAVAAIVVVVYVVLSLRLVDCRSSNNASSIDIDHGAHTFDLVLSSSPDTVSIIIGVHFCVLRLCY